MSLRWTSLVMAFALIASAIAIARPTTPLRREQRAEVEGTPLIRTTRTSVKRCDAAEPDAQTASHAPPPAVLPSRTCFALPRHSAAIATLAANTARPDVVTSIYRARAPPLA